MSDFIPITKFGYQKLINEMKYISEVEAPKVTKAIASARGLGDLSENGEYHAAKEKQSHLLSRYKYLSNIKQKAQIIDLFNANTVTFGCLVKVHNFEMNQDITYHIVGDYESDPKNHMLSNKTPIARALLGKKVGDIVSIILVAREIEFKVLEITIPS